MNANERYEARLGLCRKLRDLENNIEEVKSIREEYKQSKGDSGKFTISVYVSGKSLKYELDKRMANCCFDSIVESLRMQREEAILSLKQTMK